MTCTTWPRLCFFAGVVRKKLGLNLVSEQKDNTRVYRIVEAKSGKVVFARNADEPRFPASPRTAG